jgi:hypothetical protein
MSKGVSVKVDTAIGFVRIYFTKAPSAPHLQRELGCHRVDVYNGRIVRHQGAGQPVVIPKDDLKVTEMDEVTYAGASDAQKKEVADAVDRVAVALWELVQETDPDPGKRPRKIIVNCFAGRHRSPACVVAFIKKYGKKPGNVAYGTEEAKALVLDTLANKVNKMVEGRERKRDAHARGVQQYFGRTVGDYRRWHD